MRNAINTRSVAYWVCGRVSVILTLAIGWSAVAAEQELASQRSATEEAADQLLAERCSQCHPARIVQIRRDGRAGWERTVRRMVLRGAQLNSEAELTAMVDHLTSNYGIGKGVMITGPLPPGAALRAGANVTSSSLTLPAGAGEEIVQSLCVACHDLGRVVAASRSPRDWTQIVLDMTSRMDTKLPRNKVETVAKYLHDIATVPGTSAQ